MAEIELSVRRRNALTGVFQTSRSWNEVTAWEENANASPAPVWFTTEDARIKLKRLYPTLEG